MTDPTADLSGPADLPVPQPWAMAWRWLAGLFLDPPDAAMLAAYRGAEGQALLGALAAAPGLAGAVAEIRALTAPGADIARSAERIALAHSRAFLTGGRATVLPYASHWLNPTGLCTRSRRAR